jgi:hypothetical protein
MDQIHLSPLVDQIQLALGHISNSLSQEHHLISHKGSSRRHSPSFLGHLDAASTKELLHQGRGSPRPPPTKCLATPHQAGGSKTFADEPLSPQGFRHTLYNLIHSRITSQGRHTLHLLSSKLSLALSTHTKYVQVYG